MFILMLTFFICEYEDSRCGGMGVNDNLLMLNKKKRNV